MAKSIKQIQEQIVNDGSIKRLSESKKDYAKAGELPLTERLMLEYAVRFLEEVQSNIRKLDKIDTGRLFDEVRQSELTNKGGRLLEIVLGYFDDVKASEYAAYVNEGVQGSKSGQPNSRFKFKPTNPSMNGPMVTAIQNWVKRSGIAFKGETKGSVVGSLQRKRKAISEISKTRSTAYIIARSIKRKGLPKTGFFDKAVEMVYGKEFVQAISEAYAGDYAVYINQTNNLINKEKK